jgi:hypothetical protein
VGLAQRVEQELGEVAAQELLEPGARRRHLLRMSFELLWDLLGS